MVGGFFSILSRFGPRRGRRGVSSPMASSRSTSTRCHVGRDAPTDLTKCSAQVRPRPTACGFLKSHGAQRQGVQWSDREIDERASAIEQGEYLSDDENEHVALPSPEKQPAPGSPEARSMRDFDKEAEDATQVGKVRPLASLQETLRGRGGVVPSGRQAG